MFAASKTGRSASAVATDPYFPYVPLLLNTTSTNGQQNNTFLDSSSNAFTITRNGTPTQGAFTPYQPSGYWSGYFNGSSDYLSVASNAAFAFGTGDFTVEAWVYLTTNIANATGGYLTDFRGGSTNNFALGFIGDSGVTKMYEYVGSGPVAGTGTATVTLNNWNHVVWVRSGNTVTMYLNGTSNGSITSSYSQGSTSVTICSRYTGATEFINCYISNLRIVKGTAIYTANFTPPTTPLTAITNTSLLTLQSNRFIDNSSNAFAITVNGTPKVQAFQPFAPAASYSAATYGGSGYFNGTGDYLSIPTATPLVLAGGSWTIEAWVNPTGNYSDYRIIVNKRSGTSAASYDFYLNTGNGYLAFYNGSVFTSTSSPIANTWNHVAAVYDGTNINLYLNGTRVLQSASGNPDNGGNVFVGCDNNGVSGYFPGYISNVRIVKGTAVYTGAFTPPTLAPLQTSGAASAASYPSTTNVNTSFGAASTSLLTNFTNAGIYDAAWQNNALTVGDAQASTTITAKWPPTSMKFDGTGDIISAPASQNFVFTGNLTIEGWVWIDSTMASSRPDGLKAFIFVGWDTGNTPQFFVTGTSTTPGTGFGYYDGTTGYTATVTIPKDQWVYLAFVRSGSAIYGYVNGTQYTITASYSSTIGSSNTFVIGGNPNQSTAYYSYLKGYIQDLRITKGVARTITTPTAAFPTR